MSLNNYYTINILINEYNIHNLLQTFEILKSKYAYLSVLNAYQLHMYTKHINKHLVDILKDLTFFLN